MGVGSKLKDIYFSGEEKWYRTLDRIDAHVPIYKVIDPIDRVIPSFALFLIIIIALVLLLGFFFLGGITGQSAVLKLTVVDSKGNGVSGAEVSLAGMDGVYYSNDFGLVSDINAPLNSLLSVTASKGTKTTTVPILLDSLVKVEEIRLPVELQFAETKVITFLTETGARVNSELTLTFRCSSSDAQTPDEQTIYDGSAMVEAPSDCGVLSVTVTSPRYVTKNASLVSPSTTITLVQSTTGEMVQVTVNLKYNGTNITEVVPVQAYQANAGVVPEDTKNTTNGQATFTLEEGDYVFRVRAEAGYKAASSVVVNLLKGAARSVDIVLEKSYLGSIKVTVSEGIVPMEGAYVSLMKGMSPVNNKESDYNGEVLFSIAEVGPYKVEVTKDGYCPRSIDANIGDSIDVAMVKDLGQCGGELTVKVVDSDGKPVQYAKVVIFSDTDGDTQRLSYVEKVTDYNGVAKWKPVSYTKTGTTYKVFAHKATYSGWSTAKEFTTRNETEAFNVRLDIPMGTVAVIVKDKDNQPIQFAEVQLFEDYKNNAASGKRLIEGADGAITFNLKADKRVYAVVKMEGYESYTTMPKMMIGSGTITFNVTLSKPPVEEISVSFLGLYKNDSKALKVEPNNEYDAVFEVTAPKAYDELGFFLRVGNDNVTKTELDRLYIKEMIAPGTKQILTGASYNKPRGYSIDEKYLNLEESKWGEVVWQRGGFVQGKIRVGAKIKIKNTAQIGEQLTIAYRAWGVIDGAYERDLLDNILGTSQTSSTKQELYAATKEAYAWVGIETLCDAVQENSFCTTATYTDTDGFTNSFDTSFDAINNSPYNVAIKVMNASLVGFDNAKVKLENPEENLYLGTYSIITPNNTMTAGTINDYKTDWIDTPNFKPNSSISFNSLMVTPRKTGSGTLKLRIRDASSLIFEKDFTINISSDKKMKAQFMFNNAFQDTVPKLVSGKPETLTVKVFNLSNGLEVSGANVRLYDRFGTKLFEKVTNALGVATMDIPASLPGEKLTLKIEKSEYETLTQEITISQDIVDVTPTSLSFTVNPQTDNEDSKTVKISNMTGFDLTLKEIRLVGKFKGLLSESQIETWFDNYANTVIPSNDYVEIPFKVIVGRVIPQADDLDGVFEIVVGNSYNEWVKKVDAKIRVGLGKDVDNPNCLEISQTSWTANTQGAEIETSFDLRNNCSVDNVLVSLKNLGAQVTTGGNNLGEFSVQNTTAYSILSQNYTRVFQTTVAAGEVVPITVKFNPAGGANGTTTGAIKFEATNLSDSKDQVLTTEMTYTINVVNLQDCVILGAELVTIAEASAGQQTTGTFSMTNSCPYAVDVSIDSELPLSEKTFTMATGSAKDITITRYENDIPGAYNNLVYVRQGTNKQELLGNVKAMLESSGCFQLSRYEFDVYDNPYNQNDGTDTGYLRNTCTQKNTSAQVSGTIPFSWDDILKAAIMGAVTGGATSKKLLPDWISNALKGSNNNSVNNANLQTETLKRLNYECATSMTQIGQDRAQKLTAITSMQTALKQKSTIYQELYTTSNPCTDLSSIHSCPYKNGMIAFRTCLSARISELNTKIEDIDLKLVEFNKKYDEQVAKKKISCENYKAAQETAFKENNAKINQGIKVTEAEYKIQIGQLKSDYEAENKKIAEELKKLVNGITSIVEGSQTLLDKKCDVTYSDPGTTRTTSAEDDCVNTITSICKNQNTAIASENTLLSSAQGETASALANIENAGKSVRNMLDTLIEREPIGTDAAQLSTENTQVAKNAEPKCEAIPPEKVDAALQENPAKVVIANSGDNCTPIAITARPSENSVQANIVDEGGTSRTILAKSAKTLMASLKLTDEERAQKDAANAAAAEKAQKEAADAAAVETTSEELDEPPSTTPDTYALSDGTVLPFLEIYPEKDANPFVISDTDAERIIVYNAGSPKKVYCDQYKKLNGIWTLNPDGSNLPKSYCETQYAVIIGDDLIVASFLLATPATSVSMNTSRAGNSNMDSLSSLLMSGAIGSMGGSALGGALWAGVVAWLQAEDTVIDATYTFAVPLVEIQDVSFVSPDGISMAVGDTSYDYSGYYASQSNNFSGSTGGVPSSTGESAGAQTGYNYNAQALSATQNLVEIRELTFTNAGQAVNASPFHPFAAVLTVTGTENVYDDAYNYDTIKGAAQARGDLKKESGSFFSNFFKKSSTQIAQMSKEDLVITGTRDYTKKFHLLFNSYEYVDCGPNTYPCTGQTLGNCQVGSKFGSTGPSAVPKVKLAWDWSDISASECDEYNSNAVYCDTTQFTISTLKKLQEMKTFFMSNSLSECPQAIDVAGTKTQSLKSNTLDVGITRIQMKETTSGADIEAIVSTNNNLQMGAQMVFTLTRDDGTPVTNVNCSSTKQFTSTATFTCSVDKTVNGTGSFQVLATMTPQLCAGCENNDVSNDKITSQLLLGSTGVQNCVSYDTKKVNFERVLAANNALSTGATILQYTEFTADLVRDGFSQGFKTDFDAYSKQLASAPTYYTTEGLDKLFLSNKFKVTWPNSPAAWSAGKYKVQLIVTFDGNAGYTWDANNSNIKSVEVKLEPWGLPDPYYSIYNVAFDGVVGNASTNGRQGYGSSYTQMTEEPLVITTQGVGGTIYAQPNPANNALTNVSVSVDKSFNSLNSTRKGNVLTIQRRGDDVDFYFSPSVAVPLILNVTRTSAMDAYAFYNVSVDGAVQETGSSLMQWTGIGEGCTDFSGSGMTNWSNSGDMRSESTGDGYGLRWNNAVRAGTASFWGVLYAPQDTSTILQITKSSESASFDSSQGSGAQINIDTSTGINSLKDVLDLVADEKVCVIGSEYFWNTKTIAGNIESKIQGIESTCIPSQTN